MSETISRASVCEILSDIYLTDGEKIVSIKEVDKAYNAVLALPSAQPEQKKGTWVYKEDLKQYYCSECGYPSLTYDDTYIYGMDLPNFCEDCGADMRGEQE